jgi:hypothetical protein
MEWKNKDFFVILNSIQDPEMKGKTMWLCTKYGFFSVVCAWKDNVQGKVDFHKLMIRSRKKKHLENLLESFSLDYEIIESKNTDYRYRIIVEKPVFAELVKLAVSGIDYTNFKNKAASIKDFQYLNFLHNVWEEGNGMVYE